MHEYDVALQSILMRPDSERLTALTGADRLRWALQGRVEGRVEGSRAT